MIEVRDYIFAQYH